MPTFVYDSESTVNKIQFDPALFHYLTIVLSNCVYNGNVFISDMPSLEALIHDQFILITNLEFRGVGCSMMRGNTDSLTLGIAAGYYSSETNLTEAQALSLRVASNNAISHVTGSLIVSEVRVESTLRQQSTY